MNHHHHHPHTNSRAPADTSSPSSTPISFIISSSHRLPQEPLQKTRRVSVFVSSSFIKLHWAQKSSAPCWPLPAHSGGPPPILQLSCFIIIIKSRYRKSFQGFVLLTPELINSGNNVRLKTHITLDIHIKTYTMP